MGIFFWPLIAYNGHTLSKQSCVVCTYCRHPDLFGLHTTTGQKFETADNWENGNCVISLSKYV